MDRKGITIIAVAIVLGAACFAVSQVVAQRDFRTEPRPPGGPPVRYQVVNATEGEIIIMDVTSGDLYSARPKDVKPYSSRPRPAPGFGTHGDIDKDKVEKRIFEDKKDFFDKDKKYTFPDKDKKKAAERIFDKDKKEAFFDKDKKKEAFKKD